MIPQSRVALIAPDVLLDDKAFIRVHNKAAKDGLRDEAREHWKRRIPGHFKATARGKYGYKPRQAAYKAIKLRKYRSRTDLVRTGATRTSILSTEPEIRLGGKAANPDGTAGGLKLTMKMRLPFGQAAQQSHAKRATASKKAGYTIEKRANAGVTIEDMKREIGTILASEAKEIVTGFGAKYGKELKAALKNRPRIRKRIEDIAK